MIAANLEGCSDNHSILSMSLDMILPDWIDTDTLAMSSGRCSPVETLVGDPVTMHLEQLNERFTIPPHCVLTPPTPECELPPVPSMPRNPYIHSCSPSCPHFPYACHLSPKHQTRNANDQNRERRFWPNIIRPRTSRSRATRPSPVPVFTPGRTRSPSTSTTSSSVSSSSRSKPPPSKSILYRSSSISTKNSAAKSVKFVDMPTVYYDYGWYETPQSDPSAGPAATSRLRALKRFMRRAQKAPTSERPAISGPYRLYNAPGSTDRGKERSMHSIELIGNPGRGKLRTVLGRVTCTLP